MRLLATLLLLSLAATAQNEFVPVLNFKAPPPALLAELKQRAAAESAVTPPQGADKEYVKAAFKKELDNLIAKFNDNHLAVDSRVSEYLQSLADRIEANNNLPRDHIKVYAYRSDVPNAASLGTGVVAIMLGLLPRLQTEDQVAFVLCHEMAHVVAEHNAKSIYQEATLFNKSLSKQISKAQRGTNSYSKVAGLLEDATLDYKRHSRAFEFEADSLGLVMFLASGFDPQQALRAMDKLDSVDVDPYPAVDMRKFFNVTTPVNSMYSEVAKLHTTGDRPDSLSTHPNVKRRKEALVRQLAGVSINPGKQVRPNPVAFAAGLEMVNTGYLFKDFGVSLYHSIHLSVRYPKAYYFTAMVGQNMYEIYTRQKNHALGTSVAQPDPRFPASYNDVLIRIHRLRLKDLADVTNNFMVTRSEASFNDEHFLFALWKVSQLPGSQLDFESVKGDYMEKFPSGIYAKLFK